MWPSTPAEWRSLAMAAPRIWPSTAVTVSASAISRITRLIPTPHRLTVYASAAPLPDAPATLVIRRLARPYPSGTFPRRIALTSPSARRLRRNPHRGRRSAVPRRLDDPHLAQGIPGRRRRGDRPVRPEGRNWTAVAPPDRRIARLGDGDAADVDHRNRQFILDRFG